MDAIVKKVQEKTQAILLDNPEHFLVEVKVKPTNNIKVFIDGDKGIGIDDLVKYNRTLYKQLEEEALFPDGDYSLEVSSAGLDQPLKLHRQYLKNIDRFVEVSLQDGTKIEGKLVGATESEIIVEETRGKTSRTAKPGGGKKTEVISHTVAMATIKATLVQVKF